MLRTTSQKKRLHSLSLEARTSGGRSCDQTLGGHRRVACAHRRKFVPTLYGSALTPAVTVPLRAGRRWRIIRPAALAPLLGPPVLPSPSPLGSSPQRPRTPIRTHPRGRAHHFRDFGRRLRGYFRVDGAAPPHGIFSAHVPEAACRVWAERDLGI